MIERTRRLRLALLAMVLGIFGFASQSSSEPLPALGAALAETSVTGFSSGGYMAGQFQLAHAEHVSGAAIVAAGPWGCAESVASWFSFGPFATGWNALRALDGCMADKLAPRVPDPRALARRAEALSARRLIGPVAAVRSNRIYLFTGGRDTIVQSSIVRAAAAFYRALGVPPANILLVERPGAGHEVLTDQTGGACGSSRSPYVADCDFDQAGQILTHLLGPLQPRTAPEGDWRIFEQSSFARSGAGLATTGSVYVPPECRRSRGCRVHVVFHGCRQSREDVGDALVRGAGFDRWADGNRLILLFPEVSRSSANPYGCWDWWGYSSRNYLTRDAPQIDAVWRMLQQLAR